jgi:hypothetical protein
VTQEPATLETCSDRQAAWDAEAALRGRLAVDLRTVLRAREGVAIAAIRTLIARELAERLAAVLDYERGGRADPTSV